MRCSFSERHGRTPRPLKMNEEACAAQRLRRTHEATDSHQLTKGYYATPRQKSPRLPKGLRLQPREQPETLARVGIVVQLGQPSWFGPVLHFHCGYALDSEPSLRLEVKLPTSKRHRYVKAVSFSIDLMQNKKDRSDLLSCLCSAP